MQFWNNLSHPYVGQGTLKDKQRHFNTEWINSILWKKNVLSKIVVFNSYSEELEFLKNSRKPEASR